MGFANYIKNDLKNRIVSGKGLDGKITLHGLAEHYKVSITPVRVAIEEAIKEGFIRKLSNGRLVIVPQKIKKSSLVKVVRPPRSAQEWDQVLINDIVKASLSRKPVYLREEALAQKYKVSRSVIRQALGRFVGAGLIQHVPRCGSQVQPIQEDDLHAYLEVREVLELKALDLSKGNLKRKKLEEMLKGNHGKPDGKSSGLDNRFHMYMIKESKNRYILNFFQQYTANFYTAVFDYAAPETEVVSKMAGQHRRILNALITKHWAKARQALSEHIWAQSPILKSMLETPKSST